MIPQPHTSASAASARTLQSNANAKHNRRKLVLASSLAIVVLAGIAGLRDTATAHTATTDPAQCVACFAAPITTSGADSSVVTEAGSSSYGNIVLNQATTWDSVSSQNVADALALLPASVRSELGNPRLGVVYISVNDQGRTVSGKQPYGKAANFFSTDEGRSEVVLYPKQSVKTILHELGHAYGLRHTVGGTYGAAYLDPELRDFMDATSWRLLTPENQLAFLANQSDVSVALDGPIPWTNLSRIDPLEDFANSFAYYYAAPDQLYQLSPARYTWFATHLP